LHVRLPASGINRSAASREVLHCIAGS
jgi:hypothetical protein